MTNQEILLNYIPLISFLAKVFGPSCEIVLHDITNIQNSVIAIENNMTGRTIGSPLTDLAQNIKNNRDYENKDFMVNYNGTSKGKDFLSSTYFIKNENELIGLLCINKDISYSENIMKSLNLLLEQNNLSDPQSNLIQETLENPIEQMVTTLIAEAIEQINIPPERMSIKEKVALVKKLNSQGILKMKGSMEELAEKLKVSKPTIYRYINMKD